MTLALALSLSVQLLIMLSAGLFLTTLIHKSLKGSIRALGLSQLPMCILLGFAPWLIIHTPTYVNLYFSEIVCLILFSIYTSKNIQRKDIYFTMMSAILPLIVLVILNSQPYYMTFFYNSVLVTGISIGFSLLMLFTLKQLKFDKFYTAYLALQVIALILTAINLNDWTLFAAVLVLIASDAACLFHIYREMNHFYSTVHHEASYYKEQFEVAVEKEVKKRTFYMEHSKNKVLEMNRTDHLTKLLNRKEILAYIEVLILDKQTSKFVMFVFDIDYFKKINDTYGHTTGDVCLKTLAAVMKNNASPLDLLGRFGGDEFIIALPNLGYKEGLAYGQRFMEQVYHNTNPSFTLSMGMSVYPWDGETYKQLFEIADKGLYLAKDEGRNRIGYKGYIRA